MNRCFVEPFEATSTAEPSTQAVAIWVPMGQDIMARAEPATMSAMELAVPRSPGSSDRNHPDVSAKPMH